MSCRISYDGGNARAWLLRIVRNAAGRTAAVLVYGRRQHVIDVFAWPGVGGPFPITAESERAEGRWDGYHVRSWRQDGMILWAVSDLEPTELAGFVRLWREP